MRACLAVVCFVLGCGGSVDPAFNGQWKGTAFGTIAGKNASASFVLNVAGSGNTVTAFGLCDGSAGTMAAVGVGREAAWEGAMACPSFATPACAAAVMTMRKGAIELRADNSLHVDATGEISDCGKVVPFTWGFVGTK